MAQADHLARADGGFRRDVRWLCCRGCDGTERAQLVPCDGLFGLSIDPCIRLQRSPPPVYRSSDLANLSREATNISAALQKIPYVTSAGPFLESNFVSFGRPGESSTGALNFVTAAMFKAQQAKYVDRIVSGTGDIGPRGVLVPMELALSYALAVGQPPPLYSTSFYPPPT